MFEKLTIYRAHCDYCMKTHNLSAPKSDLKFHLKMNGWRVAKDDVTCPDCIAREAGE